jgi:hypothetical protein
LPPSPPERVIAAQARQRIAHRAADDDVGERIAGTAERRSAEIFQNLDMRGQGVARQRDLDPVDALVLILDDSVAGIVDDIDVVAEQAEEIVRPGCTGQHVIAQGRR